MSNHDDQKTLADDQPRFGSLGGSELSLDESKLSIALPKETWIDRQVDRYSDWMSAIFVKETRQSLKSRQFLWTYTVLLVVVACWTIFSLTIAFSETGDVTQAGPNMLTGYLVILGFPLCIIIPYSAYRSLATEIEDGTLQMVAITTMRPHQIIAGKLGSAVLQMLVYFSVLAPCIAFTYLLRGVDVVQIIFAIVFALVGSASLCSVGLFLSLFSKSRIGSVIISVVMIIVLIGVYSAWCGFVSALLFAGVNIFEDEGTSILLGFILLIASTGFLAFMSASAMVAFDSDNRATPVRLAMLLQQTLFLGWMFAILSQFLDTGPIYVMSMVFLHYWLLMGAILVGTSNHISRKVKRSLPKTRFGKAFFSLMMPGPGRGYLFAIGNMIACSVTLAAVVIFHDQLFTETRLSFMGTFGRGEVAESLACIGANLVYATFFLTLVFLTVAFIRKISKRSPSPAVGPLFGLLYMYGAMFICAMIQFNLFPSSRGDYTILQAPNWYWTTVNLVSSNYMEESALAVGIMGVLTVVGGFFALSMAGKELAYTSLATPVRVTEEIEEVRKSKMEYDGETFDDIFNEGRDQPIASDESPD